MSVTIWSAYHLAPPGRGPLHDRCVTKWAEHAAKFFYGFEQSPDWVYCALYRVSSHPGTAEITQNEEEKNHEPTPTQISA